MMAPPFASSWDELLALVVNQVRLDGVGKCRVECSDDPFRLRLGYKVIGESGTETAYSLPLARAKAAHKDWPNLGSNEWRASLVEPLGRGEMPSP